MKRSVTGVSIFLMTILSCSKYDTGTTRHFQEKSEMTVSVADHIKDIHLDLFLRFGEFTIVDSLLIYADYTTYVGEKAIHIFNKNNFRYITSSGITGRGPGEITRIASNAASPCKSMLWVDDHGKQVKWKFPIDSILNNNQFLPTDNVKLNPDFFFKEYEFLSDSIIIGTAVRPLSHSSMEMSTAIENINTGDIQEYGYRSPDPNNRYETYSSFKLSLDNNLYANAYTKIDLLSICSLNGELLCNIVGPMINEYGESHKLHEYFKDVDFYKEYIVASYNGGPYVILEENEPYEPVYPSRFLVFSIEGEYVKTIETGHQFTSFVIDEENKRVIVFFEDRDHPLGYFDLELAEQ